MGLAIMLFVACTEELNISSSAEKKIVFMDDQLLLSDMERETHFVDSALQAAKNTVEPGTQDNSRVLSLHSREQVIKFFKYMNAAAESDGKWLFVFWDKSSEKIVDLYGREKDKSIYIDLGIAEFESKLKKGDIDFKLIQADSKIVVD
ncbi:MAG: hypothetical protein MR298_02375 [Odoribacter sp.]|nr:hypothetical protein [Odoribacter sp.]MDY3032447.1 hypothetical protein [Odoribacter sp.]